MDGSIVAPNQRPASGMLIDNGGELPDPPARDAGLSGD
jgi:hypothetical protein